MAWSRAVVTLALAWGLIGCPGRPAPSTPGAEAGSGAALTAGSAAGSGSGAGAEVGSGAAAPANGSAAGASASTAEGSWVPEPEYSGPSWQLEGLDGLWRVAGFRFATPVAGGNLLVASQTRGRQTEVQTWVLPASPSEAAVPLAGSATWSTGRWSAPAWVPMADGAWALRPTEGAEVEGGVGALSITAVGADGQIAEVSTALPVAQNGAAGVQGAVSATPWGAGALACWPAGLTAGAAEQGVQCGAVAADLTWSIPPTAVALPPGDVMAVHVAAAPSAAGVEPEAALLLAMIREGEAGRVWAVVLRPRGILSEAVDLWGEATPMDVASSWRSTPLVRATDAGWVVGVPGRGPTNGLVASIDADGLVRHRLQVPEWSGFRAQAVLALGDTGPVLVYDEAGTAGQRSVVRWTDDGPIDSEAASPLGGTLAVRQGGIWNGQALLGFERDGVVRVALVPEGMLAR